MTALYRVFIHNISPFEYSILFLVRYSRYEVDFGIVEARERENGKEIKKSYEIDFIATLGSKKYYIRYIRSAYDIPSEEV